MRLKRAEAASAPSHAPSDAPMPTIGSNRLPLSLV
jgi:hypothetical protein